MGGLFLFHRTDLQQCPVGTHKAAPKARVHQDKWGSRGGAHACGDENMSEEPETGGFTRSDKHFRHKRNILEAFLSVFIIHIHIDRFLIQHGF